ncbi:MAG: hypothetical protein ACRD47_17705 [Nitrososphaeraceae archaeon]
MNIEKRIIAIDNPINMYEYVVRNMLVPRGSKKPINEKHAGYTPSTNPKVEPANPGLVSSFLQSKHLLLLYKYREMKIPNKIEKKPYIIALVGFCNRSLNHISRANGELIL